MVLQDEDGVRQQFNAQSSFLDADMVYGYNEHRQKKVLQHNQSYSLLKL